MTCGWNDVDGIYQEVILNWESEPRDCNGAGEPCAIEPPALLIFYLLVILQNLHNVPSKVFVVTGKEAMKVTCSEAASGKQPLTCHLLG